MLKVMTIVGTRPEIIRLSGVIAKIDLHCQHTLVHTGQSYDFELNEVFFRDLEVRKPDVFLDAAAHACRDHWPRHRCVGSCHGAFKPDCVLVLGDTNSGLCVIAAKRRKIPIFPWKPAIAASTSVYRGDQPGIIDHTLGRKPALQRHRARLSAARGSAARPDHQDAVPSTKS